jgi:hypothetical protein
MQSIANLYFNLISSAVTPSFMGKVNSNSRFENIGTYLMKDGIGGIMIRAGSTTTSLAKRLGKHTNSSKLRKVTGRESRLYSSYPHEEASEKDIDESTCSPIGRWDDIRII